MKMDSDRLDSSLGLIIGDIDSDRDDVIGKEALTWEVRLEDD